jgi:hypothetical protein
MNSFSICYCGSGAGYPHAKDCPRPIYGLVDPEREASWVEDRNALRRIGITTPPRAFPAFGCFAWLDDGVLMVDAMLKNGEPAGDPCEATEPHPSLLSQVNP